MAKSKQQKQDEALARKRQNYNLQLENWRDWGVTDKNFIACAKQHGVEAAEKRKAQADTIWCNYLKEAKLDIYGNPVSHAEVEREPIIRRKLHRPFPLGDQGLIVTIRDPVAIPVIAEVSLRNA